MNHDDMEALVARGCAQWVDKNTIVTQPCPDLMRYSDLSTDNYVVSSGGPVTIRLRTDLPKLEVR